MMAPVIPIAVAVVRRTVAVPPSSPPPPSERATLAAVERVIPVMVAPAVTAIVPVVAMTTPAEFTTSTTKAPA
jgi:hypothetical protein